MKEPKKKEKKKNKEPHKCIDKLQDYISYNSCLILFIQAKS